MKKRLHQYLSATGVFNNKNEIFQAINNKEICLDNSIITNPNFQFNINRKVTWKGKELNYKKQKKYILLNKPEGYLSARTSQNNIFELVENDNTLFSVGRLDKDTTGLLIITNDGILSHKITSPESNIGKSYEAELEKPIDNKEISLIEKGIEISLEENKKTTKYMTKSCKIERIDDKKVIITLTEGKKREVKQIFESIGNKAVKLERIAIGNIRLRELNIPKGKYLNVDRHFIEQKLK